jgi:hypothetical protein
MNQTNTVQPNRTGDNFHPTVTLPALVKQAAQQTSLAPTKTKLLSKSFNGGY